MSLGCVSSELALIDDATVGERSATACCPHQPYCLIMHLCEISQGALYLAWMILQGGRGTVDGTGLKMEWRALDGGRLEPQADADVVKALPLSSHY